MHCVVTFISVDNAMSICTICESVIFFAKGPFPMRTSEDLSSLDSPSNDSQKGKQCVLHGNLVQ